MKNFLQTVVLSSLLLSPLSSFEVSAQDQQSQFSKLALPSANVMQADALFEQKKYSEARAAYLEATKIGSPHAYYQLGTMYLKGLGVKEDLLTAIAWFSMAAEYEFSDAFNVVNELMQLIDIQEQIAVSAFMGDLKKRFGKDKLQNDLFPVLKTEVLHERVSFGGEATLDPFYQGDDYSLDDFDIGGGIYGDNSGLSDGFIDFDDPNFEQELGQQGAETSQIQNELPSVFRRKRPFAIIDYDIGHDGSIQNIYSRQTIGYPRVLIENMAANTHPAPVFKEKYVPFIGRSYLGTATYNESQFRTEFRELYNRLRRLARKLKASTDFDDMFQYAMALRNFSWLKQEDGEADTLLADVAGKGHPFAQYELDLKMYREQSDIAESVNWIVRSSQYGYANAQYTLGNLLFQSPWIDKDETKALFWLTLAGKNGHATAKLQQAKIRLLADDKNLINVNQAITLLESIESKNQDNPEYYFLLAVSHKDRENRDFRQVVSNMERAIVTGRRYNWDVSYWEGLLSKWTTGRVYVTD